MRDHEQRPDPGSGRSSALRRAPAAGVPVTAPDGRSPALDPRSIQALQRSVGNAAVVQMLHQRHTHTASCGHGPESQDTGAATVQRSAVHDVLRSAGRPLAEPLRTEMEARLGADFSSVRVHDDAAARRSSTEIGARAYTSGEHVVIGNGGGDKHTLAHELTHVVQQRQGPVAGTDAGNGLSISDPSDHYERAAEANARHVMRAPLDPQHPVQPRSAAAPDGPVTTELTTFLNDPRAYAQDHVSNNKPRLVSTALDQERGGYASNVAAGPGGRHEAGTTLVQRYQQSTTDYTVDEDPFKTQAADARAYESPDRMERKQYPWVIDHESFTNTPGVTRLRVSDDGTLAIEQVGDQQEAKVFFAQQSQLSQAQQALDEAGSLFRLDAQGPSITVGGATLARVTAVPREDSFIESMINSPTDSSMQQDSIVHKCINMANLIVNGGRVDDGSVDLKATNAYDLVHDQAGTDRVGLNMDAVRAADPQVAQLNEAVFPEIAEAYATYSLQQQDEHWNYHFAAVVAKSTDGRDRVTLENYNRQDSMTKALYEVFLGTYHSFLKEFRQEILAEVKPDNPDAETSPGFFLPMLLKKYLVVAKKKGAIAQTKADDEIKRLMRDYVAVSRWFFAMYGSGQRQTFHEFQASTPYFGDPRTVRVAARPPAPGGPSGQGQAG